MEPFTCGRCQLVIHSAAEMIDRCGFCRMRSFHAMNETLDVAPEVPSDLHPAGRNVGEPETPRVSPGTQ